MATTGSGTAGPVVGLAPRRRSSSATGDMQAFVKRSHEPWDGAIQAVATPTLGPGDVRVAVAACGICGSDLHALRSDPGFEWTAPPVVMGYELAGTVTEVAAGVERFTVGAPVVAMSMQACLRCAVCRAGTTQRCADRVIVGLSYDGGLADEVVVPAAHLIPVPEALDLQHAATIEPLSVAVRAVLSEALVAPRDRVVVSGPDPIGLLCARLAQHAGVVVCVLGAAADRSRRLPVADGWGMRTAVVGGPAPEAVLGGEPDVWIEASGAIPAVEAALGTVRRGGTVRLVALYVDSVIVSPTQAVRRELTISCSSASAAFDAALAGTAIKPLLVPTTAA